MAEDDDLWTFDVESVSKISPDPADEEGEVTYSVVFNVNGPDAMAEVEIFVTDVPDPALIITLAMATLHAALAAWARITLGRRIANDDGVPG